MKQVICFAGEIPWLFLILSLNSMLSDTVSCSSDLYHRKGFRNPDFAYIIWSVYNKKYNFQYPQNICHVSLAGFSVKDIRNSWLGQRHLPLGVYIWAWKEIPKVSLQSTKIFLNIGGYCHLRYQKTTRISVDAWQMGHMTLRRHIASEAANGG